VERWLGKFALLACAAAVFFIVGLTLLSRPAPTMKIDSLIRVLHVRRIFRRFRKRTLRRMIEAERSAADTGISDAYYARCIQLLDDDNIDATALLYSRRDASAAHAVGLAAATVRTSTVTACGEDHSLTTAKRDPCDEPRHYHIRARAASEAALSKAHKLVPAAATSCE